MVKKRLNILNKRGLSDEIIETFGLGYAPNSREAIIQYFKGKGRSENQLREAGLVSEREDGSIYDKFRHRIMFPNPGWTRAHGRFWRAHPGSE